MVFILDFIGWSTFVQEHTDELDGIWSSSLHSIMEKLTAFNIATPIE
jgi:hypothetical protein